MTIEIALTQGQTTIVDDVDADLGDLRWRALKVTTRGIPYGYYAMRRDAYMHRVILERVLGRPLLRSEHVDHIDRNKLNNRRENLRIASVAQNHINSKLNRNNTTGFKGVSAVRGRFMAYIGVNRQDVYLGLFDTPTEAHEAYLAAARHHFGAFATSGKE